MGPSSGSWLPLKGTRLSGTLEQTLHREGRMKSFALTLQLVDDPDVIAEYEKQHQSVWPGVLARIREVGITRMQIFRNGTTLFMYIDTTDAFEPARNFPRVNDDPESKRWNEWMATM